MRTERGNGLIVKAAAVGGAVVMMGALLACGSATPGARPHDMSAAQHEGMATHEEAQAGAHQERFDPNADIERTRCRPRGGRAGEPVCWTSLANPTREHLRDAEEHRRRAADHRAAAQALRDAEARACVGIAPEDRDMSPFNHGEDILRVEQLTTPTSVPTNTNPPTLLGATVEFRSVPGLTAEWLQRSIDCHLARNATMGHDASDMSYCPLMLKNVSTQVASTGDGFSVEIRSDAPAVAAEILRRAQALSRR